MTCRPVESQTDQYTGILTDRLIKRDDGQGGRMDRQKDIYRRLYHCHDNLNMNVSVSYNNQ